MELFLLGVVLILGVALILAHFEIVQLVETINIAKRALYEIKSGGVPKDSARFYAANIHEEITRRLKQRETRT